MSLGRRIVIVTPNISEQMGGEAIKAYQFLRHLVNAGEDVSVEHLRHLGIDMSAVA